MRVHTSRRGWTRSILHTSTNFDRQLREVEIQTSANNGTGTTTALPSTRTSKVFTFLNAPGALHIIATFTRL